MRDSVGLDRCGKGSRCVSAPALGGRADCSGRRLLCHWRRRPSSLPAGRRRPRPRRCSACASPCRCPTRPRPRPASPSRSSSATPARRSATPCLGATITDVIPPQLSRQVADVRFQGNFESVSYDASTGTAVFTLFSLDACWDHGAGVDRRRVPARHGRSAPRRRTTGTMRAVQRQSPVTSNQVIVISRAASDWTVTKNVVPGRGPTAGGHAVHVSRRHHVRRRRQPEPERRDLRGHAPAGRPVRVRDGRWDVQRRHQPGDVAAAQPGAQRQPERDRRSKR